MIMISDGLLYIFHIRVNCNVVVYEMRGKWFLPSKIIDYNVAHLLVQKYLLQLECAQRSRLGIFCKGVFSD